MKTVEPDAPFVRGASVAAAVSAGIFADYKKQILVSEAEEVSVR